MSSPELRPDALALTSESPWPGPAAYAERDAAFFFGRQAETTELHRLVRAEPLCVLFGLSGLGKTSLLQAGLFPRLRTDGWLPVRMRFDHGSEAPSLGRQVLDAAERAARDAGVTPPTWEGTDSLAVAFHERGRFWGVMPDPLTPVLVFDQFEEAFTQTRGDAAAESRVEAFLADLAALLERSTASAPLRVVLALREDYLATLESLRHLLPGLRRARLRLLPFTAAQALEVVVGPGQHLLEDGAAEAIVDTFVGPGESKERTATDPVLLSLFCWQLNRDRLHGPPGTRITPQQVETSRGAFLQQFYAQAFADLADDEAAAVRRFVEEQLVDDAGYRTSASVEHACRQPGVTHRALDQLVARRLLHPIDRAGGLTHLEIIHDRLADEARKGRAAARQAALKATLRRQRRIIAVLALALVWVAWRYFTPASLLTREAYGLLVGNRVSEAEEKARKAVERAPADATARAVHAIALISIANESGNSAAREQGRREAAEALRLDEHSAVAHVAQGYLHLADGYFEKKQWNTHLTAAYLGSAQRELKEAMRATARNPKGGLAHEVPAIVYDMLGLVYLEQERYDRAERSFARAIALEPALIFAWGNLVEAHIQHGRFDEAERSARRALARFPANAYPSLFLGRLYAAERKWPEAEKAFKECVKRDPSNGFFTLEVATSLIYQQKWFEAEEALKKAIALDPSNANTHLVAGQMEFWRKHYGRAEKPLTRAIALEPMMIVAHESLVACYLQQGKFADAEEAARLAQAIFSNAWPGLVLGQVLAAQGRWSEADATLEKAIQLDPANADAHYRIGQIYAANEKWVHAEDALRSALRLKPSKAAYLLQLGIVEGNQKRYDEAEALLRQASSLDPYDGAIHANLAAVLRQLGRRDEALLEAQKAVQLGFTEHEVYEALGLR